MIQTHDGDTAMHARNGSENTQVPDDAQAIIQPRKPAQRHALSKSLHVQSRTMGSARGGVRRLSPSDSQVPPAFSRRFPSCEQAYMLQHFAYPCDGVRIHPVMWACVGAFRQEAGI
jgi:hypothetical protein